MRIATVAAAAIAVVLVGSAPARAADKVVIAQTSISLGLSIVEVAIDEGFFAKHGIDPDVEIVSHGDPDTLAALHSGGAAFGAMTLVPAVQAMARGEKIRIVAPFVRNFVIQFVINPDSAKKIGLTDTMPLKERFARARGLTIGTLDVGGGLDIMFRVLAKQYGFNPLTDYTETTINSYPTLLAAAQRKEIDIALTAIPYGRLGVENNGLKMFADFWGGAIPEYVGAVHQGLVTEADYAAKNPDIVKRAHAAIDDALVLLHKQPDKAIADLHKRYPKLPESVIRSFIVDNAGSFASRAIVDRRGFDIIRNFVGDNMLPQAKSLKYSD
ncbi:MAG: ABC transporter substrate-binding protein, partial [Alphaproteobacteria bacterium]|nr:ABC transporter substrate-binding protein [Alphaproteobacteria bacterium]